MPRADNQRNESGLSAISENESTNQEFPSSKLIFDWPEGSRVLVVEDNQINQVLIEQLLIDFELQVDLVADGKEAIEMLKMSPVINPYALVLMDCQMPLMDGYTATQKIRQGEGASRYVNIPIIALTANAMADDRKKCLDAGMNDYLSKPIDPDKLIAMLKKWILSDNTESTNISE